MSTPSITISEYHNETGALLNNVSNLSFGKITKGTHSRIKVIKIAFSNITSVGNLKLGLIADAGITTNSEDGIVYEDGSMDIGHFGVVSSSNFDSSIAATPLTRHFAGINNDVTAYSEYNVSIGMNSDTVSYYIYLDIEVGSGVGVGNGAYKIFFDYT
jgi:hypothetical protein